MTSHMENSLFKYTTDVFASISLETMDNAILWEQREAPRAEAYYATTPIPYTYGTGKGTRTYHPRVDIQTKDLILMDVWQQVNRMIGTTFELLFCNRYADQHQHLGWHADDGEIIDHDRPIVVVSFGAPREIWFRTNPVTIAHGDLDHENPNPEVAQKLLLQHGSVLVMNAGFQQTHQHRIPKHFRPCGPRVSLTFRGLLSK